MWVMLKEFYRPLGNSKGPELLLCLIAGFLQFVVWMSFLMIGAKNGRDLVGLLRSAFMGYTIWLSYFGVIGVFLFSAFSVYLALKGYKWHAIFFIASNYLFGLIQFLRVEPNIDLSELLSNRSLMQFADPVVWIINVLPLFLLHLVYFRALKN
jgi:hypothetical protein